MEDEKKLNEDEQGEDNGSESEQPAEPGRPAPTPQPQGDVNAPGKDNP